AAPERHHPFRAVLAPDDHLLAFGDPVVFETYGKANGGAAHLVVRVGPASISRVVNQELSGRCDRVVEEIEQRFAPQCSLVTSWRAWQHRRWTRRSPRRLVRRRRSVQTRCG